MAVRLIALDIDGTLLDSRWQLPEANRAAIAEATRRGIEGALVTGRRYDFAMPVALKLDSPLTMIVNNGALIRSKEGRRQTAPLTLGSAMRYIPVHSSLALSCLLLLQTPARWGLGSP